MKHFTLFQGNFCHSIRLRFIARMAAGVMGTAILATLASCGGSSPEPKTIELYMQAEGFYPGEAGGSCADSASLFASRQRWFEQEILQNQLNLKVATSECRHRPSIRPYQPVPGGEIGELCLAEYRYQILAEGAVQSRSDIPLSQNHIYAPADEYEFKGLWIWGDRNPTVFGDGVFKVEFPPKFTAGYVNCGG